MPGVEDGIARFLELLAGIRNGEHTLPSSFVYLLIPGLYGNHGIVYFVGTKKFFSKMGLARHIAKIQSEASVEHNAWELKQYIEEFYWESDPHFIGSHAHGNVTFGVDLNAAPEVVLGPAPFSIGGEVPHLPSDSNGLNTCTPPSVSPYAN
ncbi:hypothetical protein L3X38_021184 [Prunus dulcis]|uniref:Uncharacterized protein n=1 Tax=Prunus dulcis TaxID=3755 RepID=A0AAD4Z3Z4_PRUDU|nr:hypothetical protein L3X38_021184 [Prunus dulcis]